MRRTLGLLDGWVVRYTETYSVEERTTVHRLRMTMDSMGWDVDLTSDDATALKGMAHQEQARLLATTAPRRCCGTYPDEPHVGCILRGGHPSVTIPSPTPVDA